MVKLIAYTKGVEGETPEDLLKMAFAQCYQKPARIETIRKNLRHMSVLEHVSFTFNLTCSRVCWEQIVRHRIASFTAQSHRYTEPSKEDTHVYIPQEVISLGNEAVLEWIADCEASHAIYMKWRERGVSRQTARYLINKGVGITATVSINLRSLLNFLGLRTDGHAQEEIRFLAWEVWGSVRDLFPNIEKDLEKIFGGEHE